MNDRRIENSVVYSTISAIVAVIVLSLARFILGMTVDALDLLIVAATVWIVSLLMRIIFYRR